MIDTARRSARSIHEALVWYHFLPLGSGAGERWYQTFQASGAEQIGLDLDVLVARLRRPEPCLEAASRELALLRRSILDLERSVPPSVRGVLEEGYRGAFAYWQFRRGDLDAADGELTLALLAVRETLRSDPFLLTFSLKNLQLITNRARVARRQGKWAAMLRCLEDCEEMLAGCAPLHCDGRSAIYFRDLCSFYQGIEPADELDAQALQVLASPVSLAMGFRSAIHSVWGSFPIANDY
jgi:hypothetical protein